MRTAHLFALAVLATTGAPAQQPAPQSQADDNAQLIVVTGQRIRDFRDALARCLARHCPPNEDADATLALAEALFLDGNYADAHSAVQASLARNRDQARNYPEPLSDLYRANTRLARHIGLDREARSSAFGILRSLQAGIPREDHRHFTARLEIAEIEMMSGDFAGAHRQLMDLARTARAAGREDVAIIAELRDRWYELVASPGSSTAMSDLIEWSRRTEPAQRVRAVGARLLLARIYRGESQTARADALLAEIAQNTRAGHARRLLSAPRYQLLQRDNAAVDGDQDLNQAIAAGDVLNRVTENYDNKWIDVGFWILPNGHVSGLELLRSGANPGWAEPLLVSIRGRLYSDSDEATYRVERYTMTAGFDTTTGSRIQHRGPGARVEMLDLTANAPPQPTPQTHPISN